MKKVFVYSAKKHFMYKWLNKEFPVWVTIRNGYASSNPLSLLANFSSDMNFRSLSSIQIHNNTINFHSPVNRDVDITYKKEV